MTTSRTSFWRKIRSGHLGAANQGENCGKPSTGLPKQAPSRTTHHQVDPSAKNASQQASKTRQHFKPRNRQRRNRSSSSSQARPIRSTSCKYGGVFWFFVLASCFASAAAGPTKMYNDATEFQEMLKGGQCFQSHEAFLMYISGAEVRIPGLRAAAV